MGLYYLRSRYYNAAKGRFLNADSVFDGANLFEYCYNNPAIYTDEYGKKPVCMEVDDYSTINDITDRLNAEMIAAYDEIKSTGIWSFAIAAYKFYENVREYGAWDLKNRKDWNLQYGEYYYYDGIKLRWDEPGNIMFGYVGSAIFDLEILQLGAGLYQQIKGKSKEEYGKGAPNFGDDPVDSRAIGYGYWLKTYDLIPHDINPIYFWPTDFIIYQEFNRYDSFFRQLH